MLGACELSMRLDAVSMARLAGIEPDNWQASILQSTAKRLLLLCSRQVGKSTAAALLALWIARYQAGASVLCLAPTLRQSEELLRTMRLLWQTLPPGDVTASADTLTRLEMSNGSRILALPGSKGDGIRGLSKIDVLILDEAARCLMELVAAARPMLAISGGRFLALSTPAGRRGWFFDEWENGIGYERYSVEASQCPRITPEFLESERRALGPTWFSQEYENAFVNAEGAVFPEAYLQRIISDEEHAWTIPPAPWAQSEVERSQAPLSWEIKIPAKNPRMTPYGVPYP